MGSLFSIFDPGVLSEWGWGLNWLSAFVILFFVPEKYWAGSSQHVKLVEGGVDAVSGEILMGFKWGSGVVTSICFVGMFLVIALNNSTGLLPYVFTSTSHLVYTVSLALPMWLGHVVYSWKKQSEIMWAHLVPLGTPGALMSFMVLVELLSSMIRPLTLSVRLAANMVAGHLLLMLLSGSMGGSFIWLSGVFVGLLCLGILEIGVAFIQSYVFSMLSSLYVQEVEGEKIVN